MYPLRLPYKKVRSRLKNLIKDGYSSEALVTSMFTVERILRRTLIQLVISAGFTTNQAFRIIARLNGLQAIKEVWTIYDPKNRTLTQILTNTIWQNLRETAKMRNGIIHGTVTYSQSKCKKKAQEIIDILDIIKEKLYATYGYHGWGGLSKRRSAVLHVDPKIIL